MFKGPFKIKISKTAEKLNVESLKKEEKDCLLYGINYDPNLHDIYQFSIIPEIIMKDDNKLPRKIKDRSYEKTSRVTIHTKVGNRNIELKGIFPRTYTEEEGWTFGFFAEAGFDIIQLAKLKLMSFIKKQFGSTSCLILASKTSNFAQWIFFKPWVKKQGDFSLRVLCLVPKILKAPDRFLRCDVRFEDGGRAIAKAMNKKIELT